MSEAVNEFERLERRPQRVRHGQPNQFQRPRRKRHAVTIALNRANDVGAPSSICVLPKPSNVTAPTGNGIFSRANSDITVTYDNVGTQDSMTGALEAGASNAGWRETAAGTRRIALTASRVPGTDAVPE